MSRGTEVSIRVVLNPTCCCACGAWFGLDDRYETHLRDSGATFYCPNGHQQVFRGGLTDSLRAEIRQRDERIAALRAKESQLANDLLDQAKEITGLKRKVRRVHKGVCPECNRTFENLQRHMATKHAPA